MSKIANRVISIPQNVKISLDDGIFSAQGPLGKSKDLTIPKEVEVVQEGDKILTSSLINNALAGTLNSLISNSIKGVVDGYKDIVEVKGIGYKVALKDGRLEFALGKSHLNYVSIPEDLKVKVESNKITVEGVDKQSVTLFSSNKIRPLRKPSVYKKSKGIYFLGEDETIKIKPGKSLNK